MPNTSSLLVLICVIALIVLLAFLPTAAIQIYKVLCDRRK